LEGYHKSAESKHPNCDADGRLYIAAVLDGYNGEIVGRAMGDNMKKELCIARLKAPAGYTVRTA